MITVVPANAASWADLRTIFGDRGDPSWCQCQWFKIRNRDWDSVTVPERSTRLREQTHCGAAQAPQTSGLVGYVDGEPAGWCAVEPRTRYVRLLTSRVVWSGRTEDKSDEGVWAVTCFVTRVGYRRQGVGAALAAATVDFARSRGARAIEGYPSVPLPGRKVSAAGLYVGTVGIFADAGFVEVARPVPHRAVMRREFA